MNNHVIIYVRSSAASRAMEELQRQEYAVRGYLSEVAIDHSEAIVISDVAVGTRIDRIGLVELTRLADQHCIGVLAIEQLSRLSRLYNGLAAAVLVLQYGGRVIGVRDQEEVDKALLAAAKLFGQSENKRNK